MEGVSAYLLMLNNYNRTNLNCNRYLAFLRCSVTSKDAGLTNWKVLYYTPFCVGGLFVSVVFISISYRG